MTKRRLISFVVYFVVFAITYFVVRTIIEGEQGKIKRLVYAAERAVEQEDLIRLSGYLSFDYYDTYGNDKHGIIFIAQRGFKEYQDISIAIKDLEIEVENLRATCEMEVVGLARREGQVKTEPLEYDIAKMKIYFKKENGNWKILKLQFLEPEDIYPLEGFGPLTKLEVIKNLS